MQANPSQTLHNYLQMHNLTAEDFADLSGMPVSEVNGILQGKLRITRLRSNHLAAVFNMDTKGLKENETRTSRSSSIRTEKTVML